MIRSGRCRAAARPPHTKGWQMTVSVDLPKDLGKDDENSSLKEILAAAGGRGPSPAVPAAGRPPAAPAPMPPHVSAPGGQRSAPRPVFDTDSGGNDTEPLHLHAHRSPAEHPPHTGQQVVVADEGDSIRCRSVHPPVAQCRRRDDHRGVDRGLECGPAEPEQRRAATGRRLREHLHPVAAAQRRGQLRRPWPAVPAGSPAG